MGARQSTYRIRDLTQAIVGIRSNRSDLLHIRSIRSPVVPFLIAPKRMVGSLQ